MNNKMEEMQATLAHMADNWKRKEEYYFNNITLTGHLVNTEIGTADKEDKDKITARKDKQKEEYTLEDDSSTSSDGSDSLEQAYKIDASYK
jgi:spermidine synthase